MTLLAGDPNFTSYCAVGPSATDGAYLSAAPFIAQYTGIASTLNCWITPSVPGQQFQMALYDGVLQQLAASALVTVATAGPVSFPLSAPLTQGRAYQPALACAGGTYQFGVDDTLPTNAFISLNGTYPLPNQLNAANASAFGAPAYFVDGLAQTNVLTTSGEYQNFWDTGKVVARAFNRSKIPSAKISDELVQVAKDELYLILINLANGPTPLWAIETKLYAMTAGQRAIQLPYGVVDMKNVNYRQMAPLQSGPQTFYTPTTPTQVPTIAVTWSGPPSSFTVTMGSTQILSVSNPNFAIGQTGFYDIDGALPASFWSVNGANISAVTFFDQLYEIPMYGYSRDEWSNLPDRSFAGSPRQFWFERQTTPILNLWPVPELFDQTQACIVAFQHRHIQDVGQLSQKLDVPQRWQPAIVDMLAESLARHPEAPPGALAECSAYAMKSLAAARGEERENAITRFQPQISCYTR